MPQRASSTGFTQAAADARYPLKYTGNEVAPVNSDDTSRGYAVGDSWVDETADKEYVCLDATEGAAVWTERTQSGGESDTNAIREFVIPASKLDPYGANYLRLTPWSATNDLELVRAADDTTEEKGACTIVVPPDVTGGSTVTFGMVGTPETAATGKTLRVKVYHRATATNEDVDVAPTSAVESGDISVAYTVSEHRQTVATWTETLSNLGWVAGDAVKLVWSRDAGHANDDLVDDWHFRTVFVRFPRS